MIGENWASFLGRMDVFPYLGLSGLYLSVATIIYQKCCSRPLIRSGYWERDLSRVKPFDSSRKRYHNSSSAHLQIRKWSSSSATRPGLDLFFAPDLLVSGLFTWSLEPLPIPWLLMAKGSPHIWRSWVLFNSIRLLPLTCPRSTLDQVFLLLVLLTRFLSKQSMYHSIIEVLTPSK